MKSGKKLLALLLSVAMILCMMPSMAFAAEDSAKSDDIVILFTNDTHCTIEKPGDATAGFAGVAALKEQKESTNKYVALVDAGDEVQGDLAGALSKGAYMIDIMNTVGYDYATPGNHEFDFGMDRFLNGIVPEAGFEYLSANFQRADGTPVFKDYAIETYGDKKVAFVGISTPETFTKSTPSYFQDEEGNYIYNFCEGNNGKDLYDAVQKSVDAAKADGADYVIAIGHLGIDEQSQPWTSKEVAANTSGIDAFIDGHSHSTFVGEEVTNKAGKTVTITQTGTKLKNIGQITINVADNTVTPELVAMKDVTIDETPSAYVQSVIDKVGEIAATVDADTNTVVGTSEVTLDINIDGQRAVRKFETTIGNLCADAYKAVMGADIGLVQGGGVRATVNAGDVTYGNLLSVNPWNNVLCVKEATGQEILDALEHGARTTPDSETGGFLQVSGITYDVDPSIKPTVVVDDKGLFQEITGARRVKNVKVNGVDIDPAATYTVATTEYILKEAGDGFTMWHGADVPASNVTDVDALVQYIKEDLSGVITAEKYGATEGRINVLDTRSDDIVVLFTNDTHCALETAPASGWSSASIGFAGLAAIKGDYKYTNNYVALVDAGDELQGGLAGSISKGEFIIPIMNAVGYDIATPGNHEFDFGVPQFMDTIVPMAKFDYVSANFVDKDNKLMLAPYKIKTYGDKKVAYVGISTPETFTTSTPKFFQDENGEFIYGFCQGNGGQDLYDAVQSAVDAAKAEGADYVIAIGHLGIGAAGNGWTSDDVAANTSGIDAFIDGHSHSKFIGREVTNKDGKVVTITQTGALFQNVGVLTIDAETGAITPDLISAEEIDMDNQDPTVKALVEKTMKDVDVATGQKVGVSEGIIERNGSAANESPAGNFCADAYKEVMGTDVAFIQSGGVRATIPEGDISYADLMKVNPWLEEVGKYEMSGQELLDALEFGSRTMPNGVGGFLYVSGMTYDIDTAIESTVTTDENGLFTGVAGEYRVKNVKVNGEDLDVNKTYIVGGPAYIIENGGDGHTFKNVKKLEMTTLIDADALVAYVTDVLKGTIPADLYADAGNRINVYTEHKAVSAENGVAATCTKEGKEADTICELCGKVLEEGKVIPTTEHKAVSAKNGAAATCTKEGKKADTICEFCGKVLEKGKVIPVTEHTYVTKITKATTKAAGKKVVKCSKCGKVKSTTTIKKIGKISLSKTAYVYNSKLKKPVVTVKNSAGTKIASKYYTVKYTNNKKVGKGKVTITFKGNYKGTVTKSFKINPKATTISKVTPKKKALTVKWAKKTVQVTGYQVRYTTDKNFKKSLKTVRIKSYKTTSKTIKNLKAGKKYYVKVRTYKIVNKVKYYSAWSKKKSATTKK